MLRVVSFFTGNRFRCVSSGPLLGDRHHLALQVGASDRVGRQTRDGYYTLIIEVGSLMSSEDQKKMMRFDFPPGATAEEIAATLTAIRDRVRREKAEAHTRAHGEEPSPSDENDTTA